MTSSILLVSLERLSRLPPTDVNHLQHRDEFVRFAELLQKQHPQIGTGSWQRFTLATALRQLGLASLVGGVASDLAVPSYELLNRLDEALRGGPIKTASPLSFGYGIGSAGARVWTKSGKDLFIQRA